MLQLSRFKNSILIGPFCNTNSHSRLKMWEFVLQSRF